MPKKRKRYTFAVPPVSPPQPTAPKGAERKRYTFAEASKGLGSLQRPEKLPKRTYTFPSTPPRVTGDTEGEHDGWRFEEPERLTGKQFKGALGARWTCVYGCKSFVWHSEPGPGQFHSYDCPYWVREGKDLSPFDD